MSSDRQMNVVTRVLASAPPAVFVSYAVIASFTTYFCMYAYRKPFSAATYEGAGGVSIPLLGDGLEMKTAFVSSQLIGYAISKFVGIKFCSEISRGRRRAALIAMILLAELSLLGFALLPGGWKVVAIFVNGLPLGMVWGLVVWYLEGRRTSELLLAGLSASFILSSGIVKDVGLWLMSDSVGVSQWWMPFVTGLIFLPLFFVSVTMLNLLPEPSAADEAERRHREPMGRRHRFGFFQRFAPGLIMLLIAYFFLTAFRDFRDNFGVEVFESLGYGEQPGIFARSEVWVAFGVLVPLGLLFMIRNNRLGLFAAMGIMVCGSVILGLSTLAYQTEMISGLTWMILIGLGAYLAYVPYGSVLFDRLIACTQTTGTAVFAIYLADTMGYTGSLTVYFFKDLILGDLSKLGFLIGFSYFMAGLGMVLITASALYLSRVTRSASSLSNDQNDGHPLHYPTVDGGVR